MNFQNPYVLLEQIAYNLRNPSVLMRKEIGEGEVSGGGVSISQAGQEEELLCFHANTQALVARSALLIGP